ncbi:WXG100 family type VII secretion target [Frankia sp. AiPs1]|uniref:WXG100 family type VII secretion target n=1 Tax=Frankia sp. AiPa1 TaxID=573492 RepID=UPI00202B1F7D|nr:WXG100 family type VII secretion target [Frankia sp. AiPa1]MCL9758033.1 WXG100 family type VII secretion target [Frankia sp. AiPa1]
MPSIRVDPDQLEQFANHVVAFGTTMSDEIRGLQTHFDGLDWEDVQRQRFAELVSEHAKRLEALVEVVGQLSPELHAKIGPLREYLGK